MAEEDESPAPEKLTGFEKYDTSVLLAVRAQQEQGLLEVLRRDDAGTVDVRAKPGAATPREAGATIKILYDAIEQELKKRGALE